MNYSFICEICRTTIIHTRKRHVRFCSSKCSNTRFKEQRATKELKFLSKLPIVQNENGCLLWKHGISDSGYGIHILDGVTWYAHRLNWFLSGRDLPKGLFLLHRCDTPRCVNIEHLFLGTPKDNMVDKVLKNRQTKGINHPASKLSESKVVEIRNSNLSSNKLAAIYGVSKTAIVKVRKYVNWK